MTFKEARMKSKLILALSLLSLASFNSLQAQTNHANHELIKKVDLKKKVSDKKRKNHDLKKVEAEKQKV